MIQQRFHQDLYAWAQKRQLKRENKKLTEERAKEAQQLLKLDDQLAAMRKRHFGKSSEKGSSARAKVKGKKQLTLHGLSLLPPPTEKELDQLKEIKFDIN